MTSSPLVPEKRTDRNGRTQTRWVRSRGAGQTTLPPLPPAVTADEPKAPTEDQLARKTFQPAVIDKLNYDDEMFHALGLREVQNYVVYSEAEMYDLLSVVSPADAFMFLSRDIQTNDGGRTTTGDEAVRLLNRTGLVNRIVDHGAMMRQAMEREISSFDVLALYCKTKTFDGYDPTLYLDAAKLGNSEEFRYEDEYWRSILKGKVRLSDVEAFGLHKASTKARHLQEWFVDLGRGAEWFDVAGLRAVSDAVEWNTDLFPTAMSLVREQGQDFFLALEHPKSAIRAQRFHAAKPPERKRALIAYMESGGDTLAALPPAELPALIDSGLAPDAAARMLDAGMTPEQAASAHQSGIGPSVSAGWL